MCFKRYMDSLFHPNKPLNPLAKEWLPSKSQKFPTFHDVLQPKFQPSTSSPLPLLLSPQQAVQPLVTYSVRLPYYNLPLPTLSSYQCVIVYNTNSQSQLFHPSPFTHFQPGGCFFGETGGAFVETKELETGTEMKREENVLKNVENQKVVRSSKANCVNGEKRRTKRFCHPKRFIGRSYRLQEKMDGGKMEWRSKEPESSSTSPLDSCHSEKTTIMIKNIPNQMRRDELMDFLDWCCREYSLEYDFLYLPMDFRTMKNLGYGFVNFTTASGAVKIKKILENYRWGAVVTSQEGFSSKKICEITWAQIQGKEMLKRRFETSIFACDRLDFLPVIMDPPRNGSSSMSSPMVLGKCTAAK